MSEAATSDFRVSGPVTFANVTGIRARGEAAIAAGGDRVVLDVSGIEHGNSVALALLIAWFRAAEVAGKSIVFTGVPAELENIVELSGLTDVLPLQGAEPAEHTFPAEAGR